MSRNNSLLAILLVVQIALAAFLLWPRSTTVAAGKLVSEVNITDVTSLTIQDSTKTVTMTKSGDAWVLPTAGDFAVRAEAVTDVISKVLAIDTRRLVASNAANYNQLKVAEGDFERKVTFGTSAGKSYSVLIGTAPSARSTNVRLVDDSNVYLTDKLSSSDIQSSVSSWINTSYLTAVATDIKAASLENPSGTLDFSRDLTGTWQLAGLAPGDTFSETVWSGWINRLANLSMTEPLGKEAKPEYGLDAPQAKLTFVTVSAAPISGTETITNAAPVMTTVTTTLAIGAEDSADSTYYVKSSSSEYYVKVSSFTVGDFVKKGRADLVLAATTPATPTVLLSEGFTVTVPITDSSVIATTPIVTDSAPLSATELLTATEPITSTP